MALHLLVVAVAQAPLVKLLQALVKEVRAVLVRLGVRAMTVYGW